MTSNVTWEGGPAFDAEGATAGEDAAELEEVYVVAALLEIVEPRLSS